MTLDAFNVLAVLVSLIHNFGITVGVGGSTVVVLLFLRAFSGGILDASERTIIRPIYFVIRIGMVCIGLALAVIGAAWTYQGGAELLKSPMYLMEWTVLAVIVINAILMTKRVMPMWLGPAIAGGSWYSLFFLTNLPFSQTSYPILLMYYAAALLLCYALFSFLLKRKAPFRSVVDPVPSIADEQHAS